MSKIYIPASQMRNAYCLLLFAKEGFRKDGYFRSENLDRSPIVKSFGGGSQSVNKLILSARDFEFPDLLTAPKRALELEILDNGGKSTAKFQIVAASSRVELLSLKQGFFLDHAISSIPVINYVLGRGRLEKVEEGTIANNEILLIKRFFQGLTSVSSA